MRLTRARLIFEIRSILEDYPIGAEFQSGVIIRELNNRGIKVYPSRVGAILREFRYNGLEFIGNGRDAKIWRKVGKLKNTAYTAKFGNPDKYETTDNN